MRIYSISSRGQPTRGGPPAWSLGEVLTTPPRKSVSYYEIFTQKALVFAVMNLRVSQNEVNFLTSGCQPEVSFEAMF